MKRPGISSGVPPLRLSRSAPSGGECVDAEPGDAVRCGASIYPLHHRGIRDLLLPQVDLSVGPEQSVADYEPSILRPNH